MTGRTAGPVAAMQRRSVEPETLDTLAANDPRAVRSRGDLRRIHVAMGTTGLLVRALRGAVPQRRPLRLLELGAGDGRQMLAVAARLAAEWPAVELTLLDRQLAVGAPALAAFARLGWTARTRVADVFDWVERPAADDDDDDHWDVIVATLFLHHFTDEPLARLLAAVAARCDVFLACEPRRGRLPLLASRLVGLLGANAVTREDAVLSVRAGFRGAELAALWPAAAPGWRLDEGAAGPFSHRFLAVRHGPALGAVAA